MKAVRRFNNNVVLCLDNNGREVVAFGKGIGFHDLPYEIEDLSKIEKTFYSIDEKYMGLINELSSEALEVSMKIFDDCIDFLDNTINNNLLITMADHIDFAVQRFKNNMNVPMPLYYDYENLYKDELDIGLNALDYIKDVYGVELPKDEAVGIAMGIINAEMVSEDSSDYKTGVFLIDDITGIIEKEMDIKIDKSNANYARYFSHMQYLVKRIYDNTQYEESNDSIYKSLARSYPKTKKCVEEIGKHIEKVSGYKCNNDELLYLMLHINRLCTREECNRNQGIT